MAEENYNYRTSQTLLRNQFPDEGKLMANMTDPQKELFTKYADCVRNIRLWPSACCSRTASAWAAE